MYDTAADTVRFDIFKNISSYLPSASFLVLNTTKVVPARLTATKETGGKVELLLLLNEWRPGEKTISAMVNRKVTVGQTLVVSDELWFTATVQHENIFVLEPNVSIEELPELLERYGTTPVPKYLTPVPMPEKHIRERYQSVFAKTPASVAAPTASLHFTPHVLTSLDNRDIPRAEVTLHVGLGTFAPVTKKNIETKKLHKEFGEITDDQAKLINRYKETKKLIAVGTTATRLLEAHAKDGMIQADSGFTDIFITPGYQFQAIDGLLTNFHLPNSSLMMLVQAFLEYKGARKSLVELYTMAINEKFRFYSFGDAMLLL